MRHPIPASPTDPDTQKFCQQIVHDITPIWVQSEPQPGAPEKDCFLIVEDHIKHHGGKAVLGWVIWEVSGVFIEAEFHCIWQDPDGVMHDVTPYPYHLDNILFLPDHTRIYSGRQVDNIRHALIKDNDVIRYLYLAKKRFEIMNTGDLADQYGEITLPPRLTREYNKIVDETQRLHTRLNRRYP
ncbi:hypothetical protein O8E94_002982 [Yersinia ruckeri]|nr:hypothetical protein [Yersinia ruckeri]